MGTHRVLQRILLLTDFMEDLGVEERVARAVEKLLAKAKVQQSFTIGDNKPAKVTK